MCILSYKYMYLTKTNIVPQRINCVKFNDDASLIISGEHNTLSSCSHSNSKVHASLLIYSAWERVYKLIDYTCRSMLLQRVEYLSDEAGLVPGIILFQAPMTPVFVCMYVLGSYDSSVRVWDCRTRTYDPVQVISEAKDSVTSLQLTCSEILTG